MNNATSTYLNGKFEEYNFLKDAIDYDKVKILFGYLNGFIDSLYLSDEITTKEHEELLSKNIELQNDKTYKILMDSANKYFSEHIKEN